jgi:hypothetical protein
MEAGSNLTRVFRGEISEGPFVPAFLYSEFLLGVIRRIWYRIEWFSPSMIYKGFIYAGKVLGGARLYTHSAT